MIESINLFINTLDMVLMKWERQKIEKKKPTWLIFFWLLMNVFIKLNKLNKLNKLIKIKITELISKLRNKLMNKI